MTRSWSTIAVAPTFLKKGKRPSRVQGGFSPFKAILVGQVGTNVTQPKVPARQLTEGPWPNAGPKLNDSGE